jgi:NAD+ kinase
MNIAIFERTFKPDFIEYYQQLFDTLKKVNATVIIHKKFNEFIKSNCHFETKIHGEFSEFTDIDKSIDLMISIGGDGTFLDAMLYVQDKEIPIIGINSGRLGFLANIAKEEIPQAMGAILKGAYSIEQRSLIQIETNNYELGHENFALNEITLMKKDSSMILIHAYLNDEYLNSYWADGLILATPTGSTAYSLSVGGPIMLPGVENFIIAPIAPHNLSARPVIVPDHYQLTFKVEGRSDEFLVALDHRHHVMGTDAEIRIKKAGFQLKMIKLKNNSFYNTLRNKLMWGADKRN